MKTSDNSSLRPHELFVCDCGDLEHQFVISTWDDYVYLSVHLIPERYFFRRLWYALKYIFGKRSIFGEFDEILVNPKDADRLQKVVDYLRTHNLHEAPPAPLEPKDDLL